MTFVDWSDTYQEFARQEEERGRQKKKIDRIVQKAEAAQRFSKMGNWK